MSHERITENQRNLQKEQDINEKSLIWVATASDGAASNREASMVLSPRRRERHSDVSSSWWRQKHRSTWLAAQLAINAYRDVYAFDVNLNISLSLSLSLRFSLFSSFLLSFFPFFLLSFFPFFLLSIFFFFAFPFLLFSFSSRSTFSFVSSVGVVFVNYYVS